MWRFIKNLKIRYKISLIVIVLAFVAIDALILTYTTNKDINDSVTNLEKYTFPVSTETSKLKDKLQLSLLFLYNYLSTGNIENYDLYRSYLGETYASELNLFNISKSKEDFVFAQNFNNHLSNIKDQTEELVNLYKANPKDPNIQIELTKLSELQTSFSSFIDTEINAKIENQVNQASEKIISSKKKITIYISIFATVILILILLTFLFLNSNISKPIKILTETAQEFGQGKFKKIKLNSTDELGLFAETFNNMAEKIIATTQSLAEELEKTKELDRQKSEFLSIAAHQLRTPMAGIKWAMTMLFDGDFGQLNDEQKHHLKNGIENSERMVKLIGDLLDVTRIQEQKFKYKFEDNNVEKIAQDVIKNLEEKSEQKKIELILHNEPNLPQAKLDRDKIYMCINNLTDNAINYSKAGGKVEINLTCTESDLVISVHDNGVGIPKAEQYRIFTKFYRGSNILKIQTEGSGLGLFIVKDIIEKHNGKVWFESEDTRGTTFFISLPLSQA